jgi:aspartyl/asparaginyl beta-hydroxylase (cupin superfamily)
MTADELRRACPFLELLEADWLALRAEATALDASDFARMGSYDEGHGGFVLHPGRFAGDFPSVDFEANRRRCPRAAAVVERIPDVLLAGFLRLEPGHVLRVHSDPREDDVLRVHLGLVLPEDERGWWPEGTARLMDVRSPHGAKNDGAVARLTMVLDVRMPFPVPSEAFGPWRPDPA